MREKMHPFLLTVFSAEKRVDLVNKLSNQRLDKIINDPPKKMVNNLFSFFPTKGKRKKLIENTIKSVLTRSKVDVTLESIKGELSCKSSGT